MNKEQIAELIQQTFVSSDKRIVFWYDHERSFDTEVNKLELEDVITWRLDEHGSIATKMEIERNCPDKKFLVYAPFERPEPHNDWLLDIYLYAEPFSADRSSLLLNTLGLQSAALNTYLSRHLDFFNSQVRLAALAKLVQPTDGEAELDLKILAVLSQADFAQVEAVTMALFGGYKSVFGQVGFNLNNARWDDVVKFKMDTAYWQFVKNHWKYTSETPKLDDLFMRLTVTHLYQAVEQVAGAVFPKELERFVLVEKDEEKNTIKSKANWIGALNASVFINSWMQNAKQSDLYIKLSEVTEQELNLDSVIDTLDATTLGQADTFEVIEKHIVVSCLDKILHGGRADLDEVDKMITLRRDRFWGSDPERSYGRIYEALNAAVRIYIMKAGYGDSFKYKTPEAMFEAYTSELYAFDQAYRHFYTAAASVKQGLDILKKDLMPAIENLYCNWYVRELALAWDLLIEDKMLTNWHVPGVLSQRTFYDKNVQPILNERDTSKAYVIISDAMRYEVGEELNRLINTGNRITSDLTAQLSVLPSCTSHGMAALLPHKNFTLGDDGCPLLDGQVAVSGMREKILKKREPSSIVVTADDLLAMTTKTGRQFVKNARVVYIYHNRIDAIGDKQATEESTFDAVATTIDELKRLVEFIHGCLNGTRIVVTADHGFLFQMSDLSVTDKSVLVSGGVVKESKKRYVVGADMPDQDQAWKFSEEAVYGTPSDMDIVVPKGGQRFHFSGGARFVHGGALLQEIVIPILTLKALKGKKAESGRATKVDIQLLDKTNMKVSNNRQRFSLLQTTKVEGKILPRILRIAFMSGSGEQISDEHIITFDSDSDQIKDRQNSILITLKGGKYDKTQDYYLVLTDNESGVEHKKLPFKINLGIGNEFGEW